MLTRLADATTHLTTVLRNCHAHRRDPHPSLAANLVDAVHALLLLLGETQEGGGVDALVWPPQEYEEPPFPVPAVEHACHCSALADELKQLESAHALLSWRHSQFNAVVEERDRMVRMLQQEAARDEDEIRQLKGLVALAGPLPELPPPSGGTATTSLGHHYQAGGGAGSSSAVVVMPAQHQEWLAMVSASSSPASHPPPPSRPLQPHEVVQREIGLVRAKDLERDDALQRQAARGRLELEAAVRAAVGDGASRARGAMGGTIDAAVTNAVTEATDAAREEERAAFALQSDWRTRQWRSEQRDSLRVCSAAVKEARSKLDAMRAHVQRSERASAAGYHALCSTLADADASRNELLIAYRQLHAQRSNEAGLAILKRALSDADEHLQTEMAKGKAVERTLREALTEAKAKQRAAESAASSGLAEARQSRRAAEKVADAAKRKLADCERAMAEASEAEAMERERLVGLSEKSSKQAARAHAQLVQAQVQVETLQVQLKEEKAQMAKANQRFAQTAGELDGRAKAAESAAEGLRADVTELSTRLASAEQQVEATKEEAKAASVAAERASEERERHFAIELTRLREAAAEAERTHSMTFEGLRRELESARQKVREAEGKRREMQQSIATVRFAAEEAMVAEEDGEDPLSRRSSSGSTTNAGSPGRRGSGGGRGVSYAREFAEIATLQLELSECEGLARNAERREAMQAARHKAIVEPLIAQREQEVAWWKAAMEEERHGLLAEADARCEELGNGWSDRCAGLEQALNDRHAELLSAQQANMALRREADSMELANISLRKEHAARVEALEMKHTALRSTLASRERLQSIEPPPAPLSASSSSFLTLAPSNHEPITPAVGHLANRGYTPGTATEVLSENVTPGSASARLKERNEMLRARLAQMARSGR